MSDRLVFVAALVVTAAIGLLWAARTVHVERLARRGGGQWLRRDRRTRLTDLVLWCLGVLWAGLLAFYLAGSLTGTLTGP